jgi:hypothetical protein
VLSVGHDGEWCVDEDGRTWQQRHLSVERCLLLSI